jgi:hypothetical protein
MAAAAPMTPAALTTKAMLARALQGARAAPAVHPPRAAVKVERQAQVQLALDTALMVPLSPS